MELILKLKNGSKEELTMDEARELYNELHQIFGKPAPSLDWPTISDRISPEPLRSSPQTWVRPVTSNTVTKFGEITDTQKEAWAKVLKKPRFLQFAGSGAI